MTPGLASRMTSAWALLDTQDAYLKSFRSSGDLMTLLSASATKQWFGIVVEWTSVGSSTGSGKASSILFPESEFLPLGT